MKRIVFCLLLMALFLAEGMIPQVSASEQTAGGIHILKTDLTGNPLEGAVFQIVRPLDEGELADRNIEKKLVKLDGTNQIMAVEAFWDHRSMTGQLCREVTTDHAGKAAVYGLPYGTYYLIETEAPEGYNRIMDPIRLSIHKYSHLTQADGITDDKGVIIDNTLHIINVRYTLPDTGSWTALQLSAAIIGVMFSSAALILLNLRRW